MLGNIHRLGISTPATGSPPHYQQHRRLKKFHKGFLAVISARAAGESPGAPNTTWGEISTRLQLESASPKEELKTSACAVTFSSWWNLKGDVSGRYLKMWWFCAVLKKESWKVWAGKDLKGHLVPSPPWAGTPSRRPARQWVHLAAFMCTQMVSLLF